MIELALTAIQCRAEAGNYLSRDALNSSLTSANSGSGWIWRSR